MMMKVENAIYAIYEGDTFIELFDSLEECARYLGIKEQSARWLTTNVARKRGVTRLIYKYNIEEREEECTN